MKPLLLLVLCAACVPPNVLGPATVFEDVPAPLDYRGELGVLTIFRQQCVVVTAAASK